MLVMTPKMTRKLPTRKTSILKSPNSKHVETSLVLKRACENPCIRLFWKKQRRFPRRVYVESHKNYLYITISALYDGWLFVLPYTRETEKQKRQSYSIEQHVSIQQDSIFAISCLYNNRARQKKLVYARQILKSFFLCVCNEAMGRKLSFKIPASF